MDSQFNALSNSGKRKGRNCQKHSRKRKKKEIRRVFYAEKDE